MTIKKCRVCGHGFFKTPLLELVDMPKAAQYLPAWGSLGSDHGVDLKVCQCSACGLVQLASKPVPYYREVIRASSVSKAMSDFRKRQFSRFVKKYALKGKKIIEIGCGRGEYLSIMRQTGAKVFGLDGLPVSRAMKQAPFDAFYIMSFLEHWPKPNAGLRTIYADLAKEAVGLVEVPNFDMILRKKLFSEFIPDHLLYFTKETLRTTLELNGFEVIELEALWHDYIISAVARKRAKLDLEPFSRAREKLKQAVNAYLRRFKKVAVWGAGHQALAAISLLKIAGRISYVVDSAAFKQGKYTPATHLPIVAPEALRSDPVEAVIVMAAGYSDEVAAVIKKQYNKNIRIAILRESSLEIDR